MQKGDLGRVRLEWRQRETVKVGSNFKLALEIRKLQGKQNKKRCEYIFVDMSSRGHEDPCKVTFS